MPAIIQSEMYLGQEFLLIAGKAAFWCGRSLGRGAGRTRLLHSAARAAPSTHLSGPFISRACFCFQAGQRLRTFGYKESRATRGRSGSQPTFVGVVAVHCEKISARKL